ncbi:MAG: glycosyltransferase family 4 protein [Xanthobacteraceae bacterium]
MTKRVSYIFPISHHFRYPFHLRLRERLAAHDVDYVVSYCAPYGANLQKNDTVDIPWGHRVPLLRIGGAQLQWAPRDVLESDLVIVQQENKLLLNYPCQILSMAGLRKVAFFGHGRNFQAADARSPGERWKRFWATKVDWWFAYTDETRSLLSGLGFPENRITVFNNAVDTSELSATAARVTPERLDQRRRELGLSGHTVGVYVGGLYPDKRLAFLVSALDRIRSEVPDFEFIIAGGGPDLPFVQAAASTRPWLKVVGPRFGDEKVELMLLGSVFLIPGLVGLAILDAATLGLPTITTNYPFHSPEIAYLRDGVNGIIVRPWEDDSEYAAQVIALLRDKRRLSAMSDAARIVGSNYTIEAMADAFSNGVLSALS